MKKLFILFILVGIISCSSEKAKPKTESKPHQTFQKIDLKWAKNFSIKKYNDYYQVDLLNQERVTQSFTLSSVKLDLKTKTYNFQTPVQSIASASCVYTKIYDVLGDLDKISGIDDLKFQFSENTVSHVKNNRTLEFGSGVNLKTEELFLLNPDVFFTWTSNQTSAQLTKLQKLGVPVLFLSSYLEEHPLARAEWIKFFALFTKKLETAERIFNRIESDYLKLQNKTYSPKSILVNAPYSGQWYIPTQKSYMGNLLKDSKFEINTFPSKNSGAISLSLEDVVARFQNAEYWINPSHYTNLTDLKNTDPRFSHIKAFKEGNIFNSSKRKRENGGNDYWELGVIRPDLVLKDLQAINNNLPQDSLFFFTKLDL